MTVALLRGMRSSDTTADVRENVRITPGNAELGEIEIVSEQIVFEAETARLFHDEVRFPEHDGHHARNRQVRLRRGRTHDDGVVVAPIRDDGAIILIRQFRHAARMWLREIPRGGRHYGESVREAAEREVREEIGYAVVDTFELGRLSPDGAEMETVPYLVGAVVRPAGAAEREDTEAIDRVFAYPYTKLREACERGDIIDSYTVAATLRLASYFEGDRFRRTSVGTTPA